MAGERIAIIAGTGISDLFKAEELETFNTPYGQSLLGHSQIGSRPVLILLRHGPAYSIPPHKINYRANIFSLRESGVDYVIATSAVGSLRKTMKPGDIVLIDQIVDLTKCRSQTFFNGEDGRVVFTDVTYPYSEKLRRSILAAAKKLRMKIHKSGTYVCMEGPRFETAGEISFLSRLGCDVVGMTGSPEVFLAKELGLEYATISIVTNWAAGIAPKVSHEEVTEMMRIKGPAVKRLIEYAIDRVEVI